jgi:hypothetical protein
MFRRTRFRPARVGCPVGGVEVCQCRVKCFQRRPESDPAGGVEELFVVEV